MSEVIYPCKTCGHAFSDHNVIKGMGECWFDLSKLDPTKGICTCRGWVAPPEAPAIARLRHAREALEKECFRVHGVGYGAIDHCGRCGRELNAVWDAVDDLLNGTLTVRQPKPTATPVERRRPLGILERFIAYLAHHD